MFRRENREETLDQISIAKKAKLRKRDEGETVKYTILFFFFFANAKVLWYFTRRHNSIQLAYLGERHMAEENRAPTCT